jgi:hypothetical protein
MFFTPEPVSPIANDIRKMYDLTRMFRSAHDLSGDVGG